MDCRVCRGRRGAQQRVGVRRAKAQRPRGHRRRREFRLGHGELESGELKLHSHGYVDADIEVYKIAVRHKYVRRGFRFSPLGGATEPSNGSESAEPVQYVHGDGNGYVRMRKFIEDDQYRYVRNVLNIHHEAEAYDAVKADEAYIKKLIIIILEVRLPTSRFQNVETIAAIPRV